VSAPVRPAATAAAAAAEASSPPSGKLMPQQDDRHDQQQQPSAALLVQDVPATTPEGGDPLDAVVFGGHGSAIVLPGPANDAAATAATTPRISASGEGEAGQAAGRTECCESDEEAAAAPRGGDAAAGDDACIGEQGSANIRAGTRSHARRCMHVGRLGA
jgi:hypothetical protein